MNQEIQSKINQKAKESLAEVIDMLDRTGKCAIVRPMGFGKTRMMCGLARRKRYAKVAYVHPTVAVKEHAEKFMGESAGKVDWYTYHTLSLMSKQPDNLAKLLETRYDLVIFDEMHHMAANLAQRTIETWLDSLDNTQTHVVGGTATSRRMDGRDVIERFFDNCVISQYSLDDAITDGIIPPLYYVYSGDGLEVVMGDTEEVINELIASGRIGTGQSDRLQVNLRERKEQASRVLNAPSIFSRAVNTVYTEGEPSYMRFLAFFPDKNTLEIKRADLEAGIQIAFPNHTVRTTIVHSDQEYRANVSLLSSLGSPRNTLDLIMCIDMLNEGYHVGTCTGVILYRPTESPIVYPQQIGRGIQVGMEHSAIVIDFVSNLKWRKIYDLCRPEYSEDGTVTVSSMAEGMVYVSPKNIHVVDLVAEAQEILRGLQTDIPSQLETDILELRKEAAPATVIYATLSKYKRYAKHGIKFGDLLDTLARLSEETGYPICERDLVKYDFKTHEYTDGPIQDYEKYAHLLNNSSKQ